MEASARSQANGQSKELKCITTDKVNGLNNWMLLFIIIFIFHYVIDNITTYGIIKTPIELTYDFIEFMQENWWYFAMTMFSYVFQIILCFLNEKALAKGILSEKVGMALHLFIFLFSFNLCFIVFYVYKFPPIAGVVAIGHIFLISLKFWGYAYENMKLRAIYKRKIAMENFDANGKSEDKKAVEYPDNVTLNNFIQFTVCSATCMYRINYPPRKPANYRKVLTGIVYISFSHYAVAFIIYQFILPEIDKTMIYIDRRQYLEVFGSALKLTLPVDMVWLLYFYLYFFKVYIPMFGWFWGVEDIVTAQDWWNSENSTVYWTKWNCQVHTWIKEYIFLPTLQMGYSKYTASLVVACFSGILHEYLISVPCRCCYGVPTLVMLAQIPLAFISTFVQRRYGAKWGNLIMCAALIFGFPICGIYVFYNYRLLNK